jgi:uncharacterized membrane protein
VVALGILVHGILVARLGGALGVDSLSSWPAATRAGLAVMFLFTATAKFNAMRHDMARMMPPWIAPHGNGLVHRVCDVLSGLGLLLAATRTAAAIALIVLLVAVLPANVHATRAGITLRGKPATPLAVRIPMQILFIALIWWSGLASGS